MQFNLRSLQSNRLPAASGKSVSGLPGDPHTFQRVYHTKHAAPGRANRAANAAGPRLATRPGHVDVGAVVSSSTRGELISPEEIKSLEGELDSGASVAALRRFNVALENLTAQNWEGKMRTVMNELAYNLESFNPAFTAVLLKVQSTIGFSDYVQRDLALKNLIQPLAGEYGMHNSQEQAKTHRQLFSEFYQDLMREPLEGVLAANPRPFWSVALFGQMMRDLQQCGGRSDPIEQASYAMGYNLAIEYLADYEKTWMLDSFRKLSRDILAPQGRALTEWVFLEVHAEGEAEHAAIGHSAVAGFVPKSHAGIVRRAMADHDRDFSAFYNALAKMLE